MHITRDVISDLWPVYASGEASEATKKLVEDFLETDVAFANQLKEASADHPALLQQASNEALEELANVTHVRKRLALRELLFGLAIFTTVCPLTAYKTSWGSGWVLRDYPFLAAGFAIAAIVCWGTYFRVRHRLESTQW